MYFCVVDSIWVKKDRSTLEIEPKVFYHTDCNKTISINGHYRYNIGETIRIVEKIK